MVYDCSQPRELWSIDFNHVCMNELASSSPHSHGQFSGAVHSHGQFSGAVHSHGQFSGAVHSHGQFSGALQCSPVGTS